MFTGLAAGALWGLDTVILGIALSMSEFVSTEQAVILAPFVSTFLHDAFSSLWMMIYTGVTAQFKNVIKALKTKSGKFIILGALLGGPIGMTGYVNAIKYIGPSYTAVISSLYPALGAFLSFIFLKEKMNLRQIAGLALSIGGVAALGFSPGGDTGESFALGFFCALLCCLGWASEGVICAYGMKDPNVSNSHALQIRQVVSALVYGIVILPAAGGWGLAADVLASKTALTVLAAAFCGTASYLCYYKTIAKKGPPKAMALNITYSSWALLFSFVLLGDIPDLKSVICAVIVVAGAMLAN
ncbi:MAG: DMT family transporter [Clostridiales bacterium]|nr:DMT family transporter [Clostridiales bacterium]